ncbi:hypothetical protein FPSE_05549 [Fusarium pseudograminearum CS3096]|uniref:Extracellular membrane protein CFEM domain-containing protein n=1 Tax=Fusarium pseudograminearum (strain CS3096) TaxID=1028729 RepID=K3VI90_FUSPC|nr:hypothetical protein FPSE_05549 [Fusarium pseudograminearum CS3096]EKJ74252.1 hypothetical protein FPSE_05549 [Fusarium pseudograminearum CS3096]
MTRLLNAFVLLGMAGSLVAGQAYDQEKQNKDATCNNNCFFKYFTNKCNEDNKACVCTLNDMREKFLCCIAENCASNVLPEQIERSGNDCVAWNLPFTFDPEAACGIKLPTSSDTSSEARSTITVVRATTSDAVTTTATGTETETTASATESSATDKTTTTSEPTPVDNGASNMKAIGGAIVLPVLLGLL